MRASSPEETIRIPRAGETSERSPIEIRHLRYFVAVADHLHFGRAARALHTAQPSLSQQIRRLERELGVDLFERDRHNVRLTLAGSAFLREARDVIRRADRSIALAREVAGGRSGRLRISCTFGSFSPEFVGVLRSFSERYPDVALDIGVRSDHQALEALAGEEIDLALLYRLPEVQRGTLALERRAVASTVPVLAVSAQHRLAAGTTVRVENIRGERILMCSRLRYPALTDRLCDMYGVAISDAPNVQPVDDPESLIGQAAAGFGIALIPALWQRCAIETARFRAIEGAEPMLPLDLYHRRDTANAAVLTFRDEIDAFLENAGDFTSHYEDVSQVNKR